jgi:hypothetical protein
MSKDHDSYYSAEVQEHFGHGRGLGAYTTGGLVIAGLVGAGIGWLIYDRMSARAEEERRQRARQTNKANARRALEMKRRAEKRERPETTTSHEGMRNIPSRP